MSLNCRSLRSKTSDLKLLIFEEKLDVIMLQETWLTQADKSIYAEFKELGYKISKLERSLRKGGGLATFINSKKINKISTFFHYKYAHFDNIVNIFNLQKYKFIVINIYRPPDLSKAQFLVEFEEFVSKILEAEGVIIMTGDFNIDMLQKNSITDRFANILNTYGLKQLITSPTREKALLDFIIIQSSYSELFTTFLPKLRYFPSDHMPLFLNSTFKARVLFQPQETIVRDFDKIDMGRVREYVKDSLLTNENFLDGCDVSECVNIYNSEVSKIVELFCPTKTRIFKHDRTKRWFNSDLQKLKQKKRRAERRSKKFPGNIDYHEAYKSSRNLYTAAIGQARINYFSNKIKIFKDDAKNLHNTIKDLSGNKKENTLPSKNEESETAINMSKFYIEKVNIIRTKISKETKNMDPTNSDGTSKSPSCFTSFKKISITEVKKIIGKLKKKFCSLDPAPVNIIMEFIDLIYPLFQRVINHSVSEGVFPNQLKQAIVSPILKCPSLDSEVFKSYRPVSSLPFLSKVLEQNLYTQLDTYFTHNNLYSSYQSAYRCNHSCETSLTKLLDDLQVFQHQKNNVILILLDQSAAFDTVDHTRLLEKLENNFGIKGNALKLLKSYLDSRTFSVKIKKHISPPSTLKHGVPQGSLLGPLFYTLYLHGIEQIALKYGFHILIYADDLQIYKPFTKESFTQMEEEVGKFLSEIKTWMSTNFLMLNKEKTLVKLFWHKGSTPNVHRILNFDIQTSIKVLGVNLEDCFKFNSFISDKVKLCNFHLRNLNNIKECLDTETRILLVTNLILSTIDYCSILLIRCNDKELRPLRLVMNKSLRFIYNVKFRQHITPFYGRCHFLDINKRIIFKACLTAYKIFYRTAPLYLEEKVRRYRPMIQSMMLRVGSGRDAQMFDENLKADHDTIITKIKKTLEQASTRITKEQ